MIKNDEFEEMSDDEDDESDKHLEAREGRFSCLKLKYITFTKFYPKMCWSTFHVNSTIQFSDFTHFTRQEKCYFHEIFAKMREAKFP